MTFLLISSTVKQLGHKQNKTNERYCTTDAVGLQLPACPGAVYIWTVFSTAAIIRYLSVLFNKLHSQYDSKDSLVIR